MFYFVVHFAQRKPPSPRIFFLFFRHPSASSTYRGQSDHIMLVGHTFSDSHSVSVSETSQSVETILRWPTWRCPWWCQWWPTWSWTWWPIKWPEKKRKNLADMFKTKSVKSLKCPKSKCIGPKLFDVKCTRLACLNQPRNHLSSSNWMSMSEAQIEAISKT